MTDADLYAGIARKDNSAFTYLYQNQYVMIKNLVSKKGGSDSDALDIFQEGIIALWTNIQQGKYTLDAKTRVSTYLYSVCNNLWLKKLRSKNKEVAFSDDWDHPDNPGEHFEIDEEYDEFQKLRDVFSQLGDKCQKILNLFYYQKSSMQEIAAVLNYEAKTAKNEKYRCMKKIRSLYDHEKH